MRFYNVNIRIAALLFLVLFLATAAAQELVTGVGFAAGRSWELYRPVVETDPSRLAGVAGGSGFEVSGLIGYRVDQAMISFRPGLLLQQTTAYRMIQDDAGLSFRRKVYPAALSLPLSASLFFGQQRFRPVLRVGGGFLVALTSSFPRRGVRPEPVLPYLDVSVGIDFAVGTVRLRPEFSVRNGTGEMFRNITREIDAGLARQRWGYACLGVVITN